MAGFASSVSNLHPRDGTQLVRVHRQRSKVVAGHQCRRRLTQNAKPMTVYRDPGTCITNCIFLNDADMILGWSDDGRAMVLRCDEQNPDSAKPVGSLRVTEPDQVGISSPALFRIGNGYSFAVGLKTGELRIFFSERMTINENRERGIVHTHRSTPLLPSETTVQGWFARRPLRKYFPMQEYSLQQQYKYPRRPSQSSDMVEIRHWGDHLHCSPIVPSCNPGFGMNHHKGWDVRLTPSSVLAVHVGLHRDMFGLRILDDRTTSENNVVIDRQQEVPIYHDVCFVNDDMIATSQTDGVVKIWDCRMIKEKRGQLSTQFPEDVIHGLNAMHTLHGRTRRQFRSQLTMLDSGHLLSVTGSHASVIDPFRGLVDREIDHTETVPEFSSLIAVDKAHGVIAQCEPSAPTIELMETNRRHGQNRKRKADPASNRLCVPANVKDVYGCDTDKVCLGTSSEVFFLVRSNLCDVFVVAFNAIGSRLVGATAEGDVVVW